MHNTSRIWHTYFISVPKENLPFLAPDGNQLFGFQTYLSFVQMLQIVQNWRWKRFHVGVKGPPGNAFPDIFTKIGGQVHIETAHTGAGSEVVFSDKLFSTEECPDDII